MKGEQTKQRAIDKASELFWRKGYHAVSVAEIAAAAGVNKATLYQYFDSKEALAVAVVESNMQRTVDYVFEGAFKEKSNPLDRLAEIYARIYETHRGTMQDYGEARGCPFVNIGMELSGESEQIRTAVTAAFAKFGTYYRAIVRDARVNKAERAQQGVEATVAALIGNMNGAMVASKLEKRPEAILDALPTAKALIAR